MRVLKTKSFARFARKEGLKDRVLSDVIADIGRGLIDADLGGGLVKQRVARDGGGKRGGFRTLIAYRAGERAIFLFGFAKKDQANISSEDERDLRDYGALLLGLKGNGIDLMIDEGELVEVRHDQKDKKVP